MRLGTIAVAGGTAVVAAATDGAPRDVTALVGPDLAAALAGDGLATLATVDVDALPVVDAPRWLPPIPRPARIFCTGFNFRAHAAESEREVPEHPTFFVRWPSSFTGHERPILRAPESDTLDWEGEVAVVIGRGGRRIARERALEHVAGYAPLGDNSIREFQLHSTQATAGKNFDATGSWGPWLVSADEAGDPASLEVRTLLNGEQVQHGRLSDLVFDVPALIAYASTFTALEPGDVIATGTPPGIGFRREPPVFLRRGDELTIELVGLTRVTNPVADG